MLVHITRYTAVQSKLADMINQELIHPSDVGLNMKNPNPVTVFIMRWRILWRTITFRQTQEILSKIEDPLLIPVTWDSVKENLYRCSIKNPCKNN